MEAMHGSKNCGNWLKIYLMVIFVGVSATETLYSDIRDLLEQPI